ncbi:tyrosine-type recombinase/integrase [Mycobacterium shigaense]|uniref:tyrosine-type recombinase/integrase n=1 Tax=Mycobacterium shigaense TaxID=722731 RepID=UPI000D48BA79|nr:tyrosine-type recombinase/integrase [Mycobacterium shigaense]MEA1120380.1 tyrosine-type recombinase/integrase [Mycobacterium shigaense]PRI14374.1 hypothetical protein B2J96_16925 [Mycobacterium shigaense]
MVAPRNLRPGLSIHGTLLVRATEFTRLLRARRLTRRQTFRDGEQRVAEGKEIVVGTLKSNENRAVVLPEFVIEALGEVARGKGRDDLFWPTSSGRYMGPPASKDSWLSGAVARCRKADPTFPRVTAYALRHTAASLAISAGANPKVVQRMLGHASTAMTLDVYADLFDSDLSSVAESVGKLWARTSQPHDCSMARTPLPAPTGTENVSPLSGLN